MILTLDQQRQLFAGYRINPGGGIVDPSGRIITRLHFRVLFGGYVFALDDGLNKLARSAVSALKNPLLAGSGCHDNALSAHHPGNPRN